MISNTFTGEWVYGIPHAIMLKWTVFQNLWYFILGSDISHIYISTEQKFSNFNVHRNHLGNLLKMQVPGYQSPKDYNFLGLD